MTSSTKSFKIRTRIMTRNRTKLSNKINVNKNDSKLNTSMSRKDVVELENIGSAESICGYKNSLESVSTENPNISKKVDVENIFLKRTRSNLSSVIDSRNEVDIHPKVINEQFPKKNLKNKNKTIVGKEEAETVALRTRNQQKTELQKKQHQIAASDENITKTVQFTPKILQNKQTKCNANLSTERKSKRQEAKPIKILKTLRSKQRKGYADLSFEKESKNEEPEPPKEQGSIQFSDEYQKAKKHMKSPVKAIVGRNEAETFIEPSRNRNKQKSKLQQTMASYEHIGNKILENNQTKQDADQPLDTKSNHKDPKPHKIMKTLQNKQPKCHADLSLEKEESNSPKMMKALRNKQTKCYADLSLEEESKNQEPTPLKKQAIPIYRVQLSPKEVCTDDHHVRKKDLYEFDDFSPKAKKQLKRIKDRRSSFVYDKNTYEILERIEAKEIKAKKNIRRNKKAAGEKYSNIVNCIVRNVMEKVQKKGNKDKVTAENEPKINKKKVVEIRDFKNEINVTVHGLMIKTSDSAKKDIESQDYVADTSRISDDCDIAPDPISDEEMNSIDNCFGFTDESPISSPIKIISDIVMKSASTPVNIQGVTRRRPNANSTMRSPWRINCIATRPIFVSIKSNALPRIDQDMVLNHMVVKDIEESNSKTVNSTVKSTTKQPVQQSILDFVDSNIDKIETLERSLFDSEQFQSPVKKNPMDKENARVNKVKRSLAGSSMVSSTPIQRKILGDISNSSGALSNRSGTNQTLFGFDDSDEERQRQDENSPVSKPSRFDLSNLKNYVVKRKKPKPKRELPTIPAEDDADQSMSILEESEDHDSNVYKLFDEPESFLDKIEPIDLIDEKKRRRERLNSTGSDLSDTEHKQKKKKKKTKVEVEQEKWIEEFNKQCDEVDNYDLTLD